MDLAKLRNIGVVAHIDAGKTTVSERILFFSGVEHRFGQVDEGTTVLDWMPEERERGITITAAATRLDWRGFAVNLIDTPGHVDFTVEVERCMRVLDGAILVIDAVAGVQAQSETVWRQIRRHGVPALAFVNKCDRPGADFLAAVASLRERLDAPAVALQVPLMGEGGVRGAVDLLTRRGREYAADGSGEWVEVGVPEELADEVEILRSDLVESLAEEDEELLADVLEDREPALEGLVAALRRRTIAGSLVPVLCGAALRNVGVQPVLDAVVDYLPSPAELPAVEGCRPDGTPGEVRHPRADEPLSALAFKLHADTHGDLTFVRIYSGTLAPGDQILNPRTRKIERVARLLRMHADARLALDSAGPGEIVALTGLKTTATGDTLTDRSSPILLESTGFPEPVISMMLEPRSSGDRDKLRSALQRLEHEDPTLGVCEDEETGQWEVAGMGELHLEVVLHRLESEHRVEVGRGQPRVAYREAPRRAGCGSGRIDRVLGGKDIFGEVEVELAPAPGGGSIRLEWADDGAVPRAFREGVAEALLLGGQVGPRFGFPLVDGVVRVVGGGSRQGKDSELGFRQAAAVALRTAMGEARVALLEPVMSFEIESPAEFVSGIIADLNGRRADMSDLLVQGQDRLVVGRVPLAHMFGYSTAVRSLSQGRASFSMEPSGFAEVPAEELEARGLVWH